MRGPAGAYKWGSGSAVVPVAGATRRVRADGRPGAPGARAGDTRSARLIWPDSGTKCDHIG
jgi:hypothetical protein